MADRAANMLNEVEDDEDEEDEEEEAMGQPAASSSSSSLSSSSSSSSSSSAMNYTEGEDDHEDDDEENGEGDENELADGDTQLAWELFECCRRIYAAHGGSEVDVPLSEVHCRLGDLERLNGNFAGAVGEYGSALELRRQVCGPTDRLLIDVHYSLAVAHIYEGGWAGRWMCR